MIEKSGRSVRLFLVDGNPTGLVTAEIINWSGHVLSGSRANLPEFLKRPELDRTGIYILFGLADGNLEQPLIYIGESDNVRTRLAQHNKDNAKIFWERTCVVTSKDQNITKAHARYLEARLIAIAAEVKNSKLVNNTTPSPQDLPEADVSDMEYFIDQIRLVLPVVGYNSFRERPKSLISDKWSEAGDNNSQIIVFELSSAKFGINAKAQEIQGEFIVSAGSNAVKAWKGGNKHNAGYAKLHAKLLDSGKLIMEPGSELAVFSEDTVFSSPSAASAIIYGRADNGRTSWRVKDKNKTYADWQQEQVELVSS